MGYRVDIQGPNESVSTYVADKFDDGVDSLDDFYDKSHFYLWSEGNYSCDCNRAIFWGRRFGEVECGESKFSVKKIAFTNGDVYEGDPRDCY